MQEEAGIFRYLPHVTLRQAWNQVKSTFIAWLILSTLFVLFSTASDFGISKTEGFWDIFPQPVWYVIGFACLSWILRGEEFKIAFPRSFKLWLLLTVFVALFALAISLLPTWAILPLYAGAIALGSMLDELAQTGKENLENSQQLNNDK